MENETNVLVEENGVLSSEAASSKTSKVAILGIAAIATVALLFKFKNKIGTKIEDAMMSRLTKKGYAVLTPVEVSELSNEVTDIIE